MAELHRLPPVDEGVRCGVLGKVHGHGVDFGFLMIVPRRDGADYASSVSWSSSGDGRHSLTVKRKGHLWKMVLEV